MSPPRRADGPFDRAPLILFWETTQACDLVCEHCRACAQPSRSPDELSTAEGKALLDDAKAMGCPLVILTGGDPAKRPDLADLVRHGSDIGLRVALTPSATPLVTEELLIELKDAGLSRLAISLDGATPEAHDRFRGFEGSFRRTFEILEQARAVGLTTQVNTTVTTYNQHELETIAELLEALDITLWAVFFVVPTGRASAAELLEPGVVEEVMHRLADIGERASFDIKTTAAPHYRRILLERKVKRAEVKGIDDGIGRAPRGVNDGQGIAFVSRAGDIFPSGFLPIPCGNVRREGLAATYREHPLFTQLRDPDQLEGKCGACPFRRVCGGSRARALAVYGRVTAEDPACSYRPKGYDRGSPPQRRLVMAANP
ncbi:MAG TPA: TIGR04053 family radical SAM/SPASM domain-containing protein [Polyangiaceae bacterium]|nr:TIGR04053 family radical SAM/SPASM domain-containing protein [Polyangiaceae bacterium]